MKKILIVGGGSFGTALGVFLSRKIDFINIYDVDKNVVDDININRKNTKYMKEVNIPDNIRAYTDLEEAAKDISYVVLAVPSHIIRIVAKSLKGKIDESIPVINLSKGIEQGSNLRLSEVIESELNNNPVVVLSGPSHAEEIVKGIPTTVVVSSKNMKYAEEVQDLLMDKVFRVYTNEDIIGVEIAGAIKNVIALAAGISDGIGYGDNSKAALMTRGMAEIVRIGTKLGGKNETFLGLTGIGDLIVTCGSVHSRNRRAGYLIGKGMNPEDAIKEVGMVVEGMKACEAFYELKEKINVEMPIIDIVYRVLYKGLNPHDGVDELLSREKKCEINF